MTFLFAVRFIFRKKLGKIRQSSRQFPLTTDKNKLWTTNGVRIGTVTKSSE